MFHMVCAVEGGLVDQLFGAGVVGGNLIKAYLLQWMEVSLIKGVLTHWDFVEADERDAMLPEGYDTRFRKQLWRR